MGNELKSVHICLFRLAWFVVLFVQMMVQTMENGILVLLGSLYFPLLPALGMLGNVVTFSVRILLASYVFQPPKTRSSASRTSILAHLLMAGDCLPCHTLHSTRPTPCLFEIKRHLRRKMSPPRRSTAEPFLCLLSCSARHLH